MVACLLFGHGDGGVLGLLGGLGHCLMASNLPNLLFKVSVCIYLHVSTSSPLVLQHVVAACVASSPIGPKKKKEKNVTFFSRFASRPSPGSGSDGGGAAQAMTISLTGLSLRALLLLLLLLSFKNGQAAAAAAAA
jgi:hypothetical protein